MEKARSPLKENVSDQEDTGINPLMRMGYLASPKRKEGPGTWSTAAVSATRPIASCWIQGVHLMLKVFFSGYTVVGSGPRQCLTHLNHQTPHIVGIP